MQSSNSEYLPQPSETSNGPPNSPASDASHKAWETAKARAVDDSRKKPYDLRRQVCRCNDANLTDFAKLLFCRLTDMCLEPDFRRGDGVLAVSKNFLADEFDCSRNTIVRAARGLEKSGFLWTKRIWTGAVEFTWWYVREWADDRFEHGNHSGANYGRRAQGVQRNTTRGEKGKFSANPESERSQFRAWKASNGNGQPPPTTVRPDLDAVHGQECALSALTNERSPRPTVAVDHGQPWPWSTATNERGQRPPVSADSVQPRARTASTSERGQRAGVTQLNTLKSSTGDLEEESFKRSTEVNAQKGRGKGRKASPENMFLLDVGAMMEKWRKGSAKAELSGSGAWWRLAYRKDPDLMQRVLADTLGAVKEGRIKESPGQHAADLWKRWGGKCA